MATTKLVLRNDWRKRSGALQIYVRVTINSLWKNYPTGQTVKGEYWNSEEGKVKKTKEIDYETINDDASAQREIINGIIRDANRLRTPVTFEYITEKIQNLQAPLPPLKEQKSFITWLDFYISENENKKAHQTIKHYRTTKNHILSFCKENNIVLTLEEFDFDIFESFKNFLLDTLAHKNKSANKYLQNIKSFLKYMSKKGLYDYKKAEDFSILPEEESMHIHLTVEELKFIDSFDFLANEALVTTRLKQKYLENDYRKLNTNFKVNFSRLEKVRDLLVLGCATGLRESDYSQIKAENVKGKIIDIYTVKTKDHLLIPLNTYSERIINKYGNELPHYSQQKFNNHLKDVVCACGVDERVLFVEYRKAIRTEKIVPKWMLISSHTCRRTFITLSLELGMQVEVVRKITGHKTGASFDKYVKITDKRKAIEMEKWND